MAKIIYYLSKDLNITNPCTHLVEPTASERGLVATHIRTKPADSFWNVVHQKINICAYTNIMRRILCGPPCNASEKKMDTVKLPLNSCNQIFMFMDCKTDAMRIYIFLTSSVHCSLYSCTPFPSIHISRLFTCAWTNNKPHLPEKDRPRYYESCPMPFCAIPALH